MSDNEFPQGTKESTMENKEPAVSALETGLTITRYFTAPGVDPADELEWERRTATINSEGGKAVFEQKDVEVPKSWSMLATNVVASKYFRGVVGTPGRENSVRKLVDRVADTITQNGWEGSYFNSGGDREVFRAELKHLLLNQKAAFNSPVWFNVGVEAQPQCSACFINSVEDDMSSILQLAKTEGMLFKYGSGTGTNLSPLRGKQEKLKGGGDASGPVSFMKGYDAFAGVIKSGGKTRRAAKMVMLDDDHPDLLEFIRCKSQEEKKAWALIDAGYDGSFNGEAYSSVFFQNSNNSVRATDGFMKRVQRDMGRTDEPPKDWNLVARTDARTMDKVNARQVFREIAEATHLCGDPGMQFDTTINSWHTCPNSGRINGSNPCSEYMHVDDSACNLASLNLMHFRMADGEFNVEAFEHAVYIMLLAQEIIVSFSGYPTREIHKNSRAMRQLGLGYANLGALLMASGLPYDSEEGRNYAAAITSLMGGHAYAVSAIMAEKMGPFAEYEKNKVPMLGVISKHREASHKVKKKGVPDGLWRAQVEAWDRAIMGAHYGFRNSQVTVLAPTGTIGFMMDCDTTGIEPDIALIKYKKLVGGGMVKIVNQTVHKALAKLEYTLEEGRRILDYLDTNDTIEGAPDLKPEHLPVFDCAFKPSRGQRSIGWMGHIQMMEACQPFLSGAISKTVNMPSNATVEQIEEAYLEAWKRGLKAVAIYRDGCKRTQPLNTSRETKPDEVTPITPIPSTATRRRLPDERQSITKKFKIGEFEWYLSVGLYEDGTPGEIFITMAKEGSLVSGLMDSFATSISLGLQYGVPVKVLVDKFKGMRFEPEGFTGNSELPIVKSIIDYIFRWLEQKFISTEPGEEKQVITESKTSVFANQSDAPPCSTCGSLMVRNGACYKCSNCGGTSGCS